MKNQHTPIQNQCEPRAKAHSALAIRALSFFRHSSFVISHLLLLIVLPLAAIAQDKIVTPVPAIGTEHADDAPLAFPPVEHYAKLWENSMFTTKALPPPDDAPKGPIFSDALTLVGIYEVDGGVVGVLMDKTTSQVMEVRIGAENEAGIKIARVNPGSTPDKTRLQLQKGQEAGWVAFSMEAAPSADQTTQQGIPVGPGTQAGNAIPGRPVIPQPQANMPPQQNQGAPGGPRSIPGGAPAMRSQRAAPPPQSIPQQIPQSPIAPVIPTPAPAAGDGDIPLPPQ